MALMNVRFEGNNGQDADMTLCLLGLSSSAQTIGRLQRVRATVTI